MPIGIRKRQQNAFPFRLYKKIFFFICGNNLLQIPPIPLL
ncbi:hypothetical protein T4E_5496 [Trichinella pseudospiralis]|uniref:Uncharacterized protein n=1 Tax=Trichinella pseudospiralis TaxID=6337 RepID=A0A0V0X0E4_TRIPS|nr:hypothetical protein T4E_5496 [Trichinella pseudospiralis]